MMGHAVAKPFSSLCHVHVCLFYREETCTCLLGGEAEQASVSAVPASRVSTSHLLDQSIGEVCTVLVEGKKCPARCPAIYPGSPEIKNGDQ